MTNNPRLMAYTAAAMYGAGLVDGTVEGFLPGDPPFSLVPVLVVGVIFVVLLTVGPRFPRWVLVAFGPIGAVLVAYAMSTTPAPGDAAALYALPVLWMSVFCGRRGAIAIVAWVGLVHTVALLELPAGLSYPGRWIDVMVSTAAIATVALMLERRNERLLERLAAEARTDSLTHLLNRRGFDERAAHELAHARRDGTSLAIVTFDIDYFKRINDEWGHEMGDRVLEWIGEVLLRAAREVDTVARVGGEEFVVLLPGTDEQGAAAFAERVRATLADAGRGDLPAVRVSAGIACADAPAAIGTILQRADSALYEAKRSGRDRAVVFAGH